MNYELFFDNTDEPVEVLHIGGHFDGLRKLCGYLPKQWRIKIPKSVPYTMIRTKQVRPEKFEEAVYERHQISTPKHKYYVYRYIGITDDELIEKLIKGYREYEHPDDHETSKKARTSTVHIPRRPRS